MINNCVNNDNIDNDRLETLLNRISKVKNSKEIKKNVKNFAEELNARIEEFASPFILLGYDVNGGYFQISNFKTQKDYDSLVVALDRCKTYGFKSDVDPKGLQFDDDDDEDINS